jgi:uncharacterized damage-inducible protein DinB
MEFNTLYQELQNSTEMIPALLLGVEPEAARLTPRAESWSMLEVVCHLYISISSFTANMKNGMR